MYAFGWYECMRSGLLYGILSSEALTCLLWYKYSVHVYALGQVQSSFRRL